MLEQLAFCVNLFKRMEHLLPWLAVGHIFLKHSFKNIDHVLIGDFEIEVSIHNLPARVAGGRVPETRFITQKQGLLHVEQSEQKRRQMREEQRTQTQSGGNRWETNSQSTAKPWHRQ